MKNRGRFLAAAAGMTLAVVAVVAIGCEGPKAPAASPTSSGYVRKPPVDWDNPISGRVVGSQTEAQSALDFEIYSPQGLERLTRVIVTGNSAPTRDRVLALVYDTAKYGRVVIEEHFPYVPAAEYDAVNASFVAQNGRRETHGTAEVILVRDGKKALLTTSEDKKNSTVWWLENEIEIIVRGPSLDRSDCLEISDTI